MKVAVLGNSRYNGILKEQLSKEGLSTEFFENIDEIKSISGEAGAFLIKTQKNAVEAGYVIVAGDPSTLEDSSTAQESERQVVILLDYPEESPAYMTETALTKAIRLAGKQKKVFYLSKFMRISGNGLEELYKQARNMGVAFIRYTGIDISRDNCTGMFHLNISDGYDEIGIDTFSLIKTRAAGGNNAARLSGLLKFKLDKGTYASGSSYFLSPSVTSRKGVYFLDGASAGNLGEEIIRQIRFTVSEISSNSAKTCEQTEYAEVDPGKCAFCYTCYRACPHSAMIPDYGNSAMKNLNKACQACGICVSVCPADAIKIKGMDSVVKTVPNSLMVYCCENSGEIAVNRIADEIAGIFEKISIASVSCGGEISAEKIVDALKSYEKVLYVTCKDDACRHFDGNKRARLQTDRAKEMLRSAGLDDSRIVYMQVSHAMPNVLRDNIRDLVLQRQLPI
ncbi:MAG: hydrogenase iron-sulfur subunit [Ruminiclostridium sp.]|nr:hydrogenase iron-sulfur subunit [Ruminiclostridium sp.]